MKIPEILIRQADKLEAYYKENYPSLSSLVRQCFLNTIETTVKQLEDGSYFVITGDIPAMWLRDSAAQVGLYTRFAADEPELQEILEGIIAKQAELVLIDPYANAFNPDGSDPERGFPDDTERNPHVWERKYEVDSLCAPVYLAYSYWKETGRTEIFTQDWLAMVHKIIGTFRTEQDHSRSPYYFQRFDCPASDTLPHDGRGNPVGKTGMTWSGFRPSDDSCEYGYLIPSEIMAVCALRKAAEIATDVYHDDQTAQDAKALALEIEQGIEKYGIVDHPKYGRIYAYEVDGLGNTNLMDDANSPSLLAIPYLGYASTDDPLYQATRRFVLSEDNPYYCKGKYAEGVGSPHTPEGYVWHIGMIVQALTSVNRGEIDRILKMLGNTHAGTNFIHESFDPDDPEKYTRPWFAWANTLFAVLLENLMEADYFNM